MNHELWGSEIHGRQVVTGKRYSIGSYSAGCIEGAVAIASTGPGFQNMRRSRKRGYGHPALIVYIEKLGAKLLAADLGPILVGDLGQQRGGPFKKGHASHQTGLDVDIWYWHPPRAERHQLSRRARETISAKAVVDGKKKLMTRYWKDEMAEMLRMAASEPEVSRIFVNPVIKSQLCTSTRGDREYLRKIRPWFGHTDHMHVRLYCPDNSPLCEPQNAIPKGDGCDELDWWLDDEAQAERIKNKKKYQSKVGVSPQLPDACSAVLEAD